MPTDRPTTKVLISRVVQYAKTQVSDEKQFELFSRFIRLFYSHASITDLYHRPLPELYGMAQSHWALVCRQQKSDLRHIRVFNPDLENDGWHSTHTIIEVISKDMPFIVDSMRMEISRLGFNVHLMIHMGGMQISRDQSGYVTDVAGYHLNHKSTMTIEAPVYMEIDRQTDPAVLAMIHDNLERVLADVQVTVTDWEEMQVRVSEAIQELSKNEAHLPEEEISESVAFLQWLLEGQFTFLGVRDYEVVGVGDAMGLRLVKGSGLGVLRDESESKMYRQFSDMPEPARELMLSSKELLVISKTSTLSTVHRLAYTDYIGIKRFNAQGELIGERRIIGLYTSTAYSSHPKDIPFLRHKVVSVMNKSGLPPKSHAGKDLMHILETFPRDDLFQATTDELFHTAIGILNLQERRKIGIFVREDAYGRYVSCLVYVPRDNFNSQLIFRVQSLLMETFKGVESNYTTYFHTPVLTRIHYTIRLQSKKKLRYNREQLESQLIEVTKSWQDGLRESTLEYFGEERGNQLINKYFDAFPVGYREAFTPMNAVIDIEHIESMSSNEVLGMSLYHPLGMSLQEVKFKLFRYGQTVPLSDALPILENMGLRVIEEQPYQLVFKDDTQLWINDFTMTFRQEVTFEIDTIRTQFQEAFSKTWSGEAENDLLNALVLEAGLNWREIAVLRAYTKYLWQTGFTYSTQYIAEAFIKYPNIVNLLIQLFHCCFDPNLQALREQQEEKRLGRLIYQKVDEVISLDEDRIFRRLLVVMHATLRTNFYQCDAKGLYKPYITFKLFPKKIPDMPLPLPRYEIFVYSPDFEGVHLRSAKVARGGLRWSDRREDFRTEILGLMKAQQVKNAVIVPAGAKGGFVPKNLPRDGSREAILQEAIRCYSSFIQGLLDVTDNLVGTKVVSPKDTVCYDDADTYLVVAADKGTATFSDIANKIAVNHGFWLGDAFASGGSAGYDHKKMGITAKGAWVSAERHFQGLGIKLDANEITVVGIGDMAGDVFGNGLLMSPHLKLVCAFNHMHIFLDPNPNPAVSYEERTRLFALPRSTWVDYQSDLISTGGGVYPRAAKFIPISPEVKALLGITEDRLIPNDLIRVILKAPVDMIWNGGIGTFVKASTETHEAAGDRANDLLRINGNELKARVVVEGGNLGLTQLGRIEYALNGGLINTDFIDNSAGVDCSDHEVNIKILLNSVVASGEMTEKQRNQLLVSMTNEVSALVLQHNYQQNESVTCLAATSLEHIDLYIRYIDVQEKAKKINRSLEFLPDAKTLLERRNNSQGLTRPEIAVLFSYCKIFLEDKIRHSKLVDDPALIHYLYQAFPSQIRKKYANNILQHRLRKEIISTQLSNQIVSQMGMTFVYQMQDETSASITAIVRAFVAAYHIFHIADMHAEIEALDYKVAVDVQHRMLNEVTRLVRRATRWLLRIYRDTINIEKTISYFEPHVKELFKRLPKLLLGGGKESLSAQCDELMQAGVPEDLALRVASARPVYHALNVIQVSTANETDVYDTAKIYFTLVDSLGLYWLRNKINEHPVTHRWSVLTKSAFKSDLDWVQRELTSAVLRLTAPTKSITVQVSAWLDRYQELVQRWHSLLADLKNEEITDFSIVSVAIRELSDFVRTCSEAAS